MTAQPELSIVVVNWNSAEYLRPCLASIFSGRTQFSFEVLVVDNGSYDGCGEMLRSHFPQVRFLQASQNLGFAAANNLAFPFSAGRNLLFLNPDTEVVGPALQHMLHVLAATPDAAIVAPRLVDPKFSTEWNCMRSFPTILNQVLDAAITRRILPLRWWGLDVVARASHLPLPAQVVPGTCLMIRREVFDTTRFNENYFLYAEDVDLCYRVRQLGWKIYYLHDAVVIHHGGRSSQMQPQTAFSAVLMRDSVWRLLKATRGPGYAAAYRTATGIAAGCRLVLCGGRWVVAGPGGRAVWQQAAIKWRRVLRWAVGQESWVRSLNGRRARSPVLLTISPVSQRGRARA